MTLPNSSFPRCRMNFYSTSIFLLILTTTMAVWPSGDRGRFCPQLNRVINGTIKNSKALSGQTVTINYQASSPDYLLAVNGNSRPSSGFIFQVMELVAQLGGFSLNWVQTPIPGNMTLTTYLYRSLLHPTGIDLATDIVYSDLVDRRNNGVQFTQPVADNSVILVTTFHQKTVAASIMAFASPFDNYVWMSIMLCVCFNGALFTVIERIGKLLDHPAVLNGKYTEPKIAETKEEPKTEEKKDESNTGKDKEEDSGLLWNVFKAIYLSFGSYVSAGGGESISGANTYATAILLSGFSFLMVIIGSSYTAGLAGAVVSNSGTVQTLTSINDAIASTTITICALSGTSPLQTLQTLYPKVRINQINGHPNDWVYLLRQVADGNCMGAVIPAAYFDFVSVNPAANPHCNLIQAGPPLQNINGAFGYVADYSQHCTSFMMDQVSAIIVSLKQSGTLDQVYKSTILQNNNLNCPKQSTDSANASQQLTMGHLKGVFVLYGVAAITAFVMFAIHAIHHIASKSPDTKSIGTHAVNFPMAGILKPFMKKRGVRICVKGIQSHGQNNA